jgi:hypothetical protein
MAARIVAVAFLAAFAALVHADPGPATFGPAPADKLSGRVNFVGSASYAFINRPLSVQFAFSKLQNQHATSASNALSVAVVLAGDAIVPGAPFVGWFVAFWDAPTTLAPGASFDNVNTTELVEVVPPDGIYYVHLFSLEQNPACGFEYCYDDYRVFTTRVRIYQGSFYTYGGSPLPGVEGLAVEYFHAGMGHYFVTAQEDEIAGLDAGAFAGWARTGETFRVWLAGGQSLADVCRFFTTAFAPKSSHFYTAIAQECEGLKAGQVWTYEKLAFRILLPDAGPTCPIGVPLYRLYNDGKTGAPNHRYTTRLALRAELIAQGFVPEDANTVCVAGGAPP